MAETTVKRARKATGAPPDIKKVDKAVAPPKTPKLGRPTKYNQEIADLICLMLSEGLSLRQIIKADTENKIPPQATVYQWLIKHESFREQYARAREEQAETNADEILEIADEKPPVNTDDRGRTLMDGAYIQWQKQRIEARKWTAMKLKPKKYGDRMAVEGVENGAPITTQDATANKFFEMIRNLEMKKRGD